MKKLLSQNKILQRAIARISLRGILGINFEQCRRCVRFVQASFLQSRWHGTEKYILHLFFVFVCPYVHIYNVHELDHVCLLVKKKGRPFIKNPFNSKMISKIYIYRPLDAIRDTWSVAFDFANNASAIKCWKKEECSRGEQFNN